MEMQVPEYKCDTAGCGNAGTLYTIEVRGRRVAVALCKTHEAALVAVMALGEVVTPETGRRKPVRGGTSRMALRGLYADE